MRKKKNCSGCRALVGTNCSLGYKTETEQEIVTKRFVNYTKPLEECPKPKIYSDYIYLLKIKSTNNETR